MSKPAHVVSSQLLRDWPLPDVEDGAGKGARGTVVVIGGAADAPGAVLLAGIAALRVGAGRLTLATAAVNASSLAVAVPESAVTALPVTAEGAIGGDAVEACRSLLAGAQALVLGPGMRDPEATRVVVRSVLQSVAEETTVVLDALALTCGGFDDELRARLGKRVIATPNRKEASFLLDGDVPDDDEQAARAVAGRTGTVVAMQSVIVTPDGQAWVDQSGDSGLGTSGSGDVLAGTIAGLAARGATPEQAAVWGAHLHADAGERLSARVGRLGYLARELLDELPQVLTQLER
jgi:ADP-dependent NAD(P)H-hydrate dehydratase